MVRKAVQSKLPAKADRKQAVVWFDKSDMKIIEKASRKLYGQTNKSRFIRETALDQAIITLNPIVETPKTQSEPNNTKLPINLGF